MEELEPPMQVVKPNIRGITEIWQNSSHDWNTGTIGYVLFRRERSKDTKVAL